MTSAPMALAMMLITSAAWADEGIGFLQPLLAPLYQLALEPQRRQAAGGRDAVDVPPAQAVVRVEHCSQLVGRTVHPRGRAVGDRLVHHAPRQHVVAPPHALADVEK